MAPSRHLFRKEPQQVLELAHNWASEAARLPGAISIQRHAWRRRVRHAQRRRGADERAIVQPQGELSRCVYTQMEPSECAILRSIKSSHLEAVAAGACTCRCEFVRGHWETAGAESHAAPCPCSTRPSSPNQLPPLRPLTERVGSRAKAACCSWWASEEVLCLTRTLGSAVPQHGSQGSNTQAGANGQTGCERGRWCFLSI